MRRPPLQPVRRARHLVAYGSTNKDRPVKTARRAGPPLAEATEFVYFFCAMATMLMITATVKAIDSQGWVCFDNSESLNHAAFCPLLVSEAVISKPSPLAASFLSGSLRTAPIAMQARPVRQPANAAIS
jgi:hypothetical protein